MQTLAATSFGTVALVILFLIISLALIGMVLIQRPSGGGLSGAFGSGSGSGQTAFGTKTGDALTIITVCFFVVWLGLAMGLNWATKPPKPTLQPTAQGTDEQTDQSADQSTDQTSDETSDQTQGQPDADLPQGDQTPPTSDGADQPADQPADTTTDTPPAGDDPAAPDPSGSKPTPTDPASSEPPAPSDPGGGF